MKPSALEKVIDAEPFRPYRLTLSNGEVVTVSKPFKSHVSGDVVSLDGVTKQKSGLSVHRFRMIPIQLIESVELLTA